MTFLQEAFDAVLGAEFSPTKVTHRLILSKFAKAGIKLSKRLEKDLEKQIDENIDKPELQINIDDAAILKLNPHLPKDFDLSVRLTSKDYDAYLRKANKQLTQTVPKVVLDSGDRLYKKLRQNRKATLALIAFQRKGFEERLQRFWRVPIETLDMFIAAAQQAGADANERGRPKAVKENDIVFEALTRLHARSCRTGQEVLALIKSGFADGANARWRTIHELAVVANFLAKHGNDAANRYLLHQHVETLRAANQYNEYYRHLGQRKVPAKEIRRLTATVDKLKQKFGTNYSKEYGWASAALGHPKNLRFRNIEESIDLDFWRPYYKMASHSVHAGPKSVLPAKRTLSAYISSAWACSMPIEMLQKRAENAEITLATPGAKRNVW